MDDKDIISKLKEFQIEGNDLKKNLVNAEYGSDIRKNREQGGKVESWRGKCLNLLKLKFGLNSIHFNDFKNKIDRNHEGYYNQVNVDLALGVLSWIIDALESGATEDLFYKREIILFDDLLKQAYEFYSQNLELASAIYGRIVLETIIKEFASKNSIEVGSFEQTIINLRKKEKITIPVEHSLRAHYKIGSDAAHNSKEFERISSQEIKNMLDFIRDKVLTLE